MKPFTIWISPVSVFRHHNICGDAVVVSRYDRQVHTMPWVGLEGKPFSFMPQLFVMNGKSYYPSEQPTIP